MNMIDCKEKMLSHPDMRELLKFSGKNKPLNDCIDFICSDHTLNENQLVRSILKCSDAICNGVKIFISYKLSQPNTARALLEVFKLYGKAHICFDERWPFLAERSQQAGMNYRDAILSALDQAHWFFLILPDDDIDRTWTLFEAGYFRKGMLPYADRLICLHHPSVSRAGPIDSFHAFSATQQDLCNMLNELLNENNAIPGMPAIHGELSSEILERHASEIAETIVPEAISRQYLIPYVDVTISAQDFQRSDVDVLDLNVEAFHLMRDVFGYIGDKNVPFRRILGEDRELLEVELWAKPLGRLILLACKGTVPKFVCPSFWGTDGCLYRPYVHSIRRSSHTGRVTSAHVAFSEVVTGRIRSAPAELQALAAALRLGFAFRWLILDASVVTPHDVEEVEQRVRVVELEAMQRGLSFPTTDDPNEFEPTILASAFEGEARERIAAVFAKTLQFHAPDGSGELDRALQERNASKTRECLRKLRSLNGEFMRMGSVRYAELVAKYWDEEAEK
jgi:hypothetical protein